MKTYKITRPSKYTKNGEGKTAWLPVGRIVMFDDGGLKLELNHTSEEFKIFEDKPKEEFTPADNRKNDVKVEDIPF